MGVPRLTPWLISIFRGISILIKKGAFAIEVDGLYIDSQSILHLCCQICFNYGVKKRLMDPFTSLSYDEKRLKVYSLFFETIKIITKMVVPRKTLFISNDGPAPIAKQSQQRQRRFNSSSNREEGAFDSNSLTPGTTFMYELTKYMHYAIRKEMQINEKWRKIDVIFSGCNEEGEGEHKLLDFIRKLPDKDRQSHCIVGPDGDLIMLALAAHTPNIYLLREDPDFVDIYYLLNMGKVREELPRIVFPPAPKSTIVPGYGGRTIESVDGFVDDFVILGFLVGNDFLPKVQMFMYLEDGLELMIKEYIDLYTQTGKYLTTNGVIDPEIFTMFIKQLSSNEITYLESQAPYSLEILGKTDPKYLSKGGWKGEHQGGSRRVEANPEFIDHTLLNSLDADGKLDFAKYREVYYLKSDIDITTQGGKEGLRLMCMDYLKTIVWIGEYYITGLPSWDYYYPWHYPPLMTDLADALSGTSGRPISFEELSTFDKGSPSLPFVQLLCVLPQKSSSLLPEPFRMLMLDPESPLVKAGVYNMDFKIDYEGKTKKHFGITLLGFADVKLVRKCYQLMMQKILSQTGKDEKKIFKRNQLTKARIFSFDQNFNGLYKSKFGEFKTNVRDEDL